MTYKGYPARIEYSSEDECFIGHIVGIRDIVGFHAESVAELRTAFQESVEDYLETCAQLGKAPQKSFSGRLMLRIAPEVHAAVASAAKINGMSINQWAAHCLEQHSRRIVA